MAVSHLLVQGHFLARTWAKHRPPVLSATVAGNCGLVIAQPPIKNPPHPRYRSAHAGGMPSYGMSKLLTIQRLSLPAALALCAAIMLVTAAVLAWMGQLLICTCGYVKLCHASSPDSESPNPL